MYSAVLKLNSLNPKPPRTRIAIIAIGESKWPYAAPGLLITIDPRMLDFVEWHIDDWTAFGSDRGITM